MLKENDLRFVVFCYSFPANPTHLSTKIRILTIFKKSSSNDSGISPKSAVVTKGLKIRVKTHFVRMASLQRISSVRKVFQNQGSVVRMMSNDTGRSAGMCFEFLSYLRK